MLCWMIIILFGLGYAYLFTFISDKLYFLPLYLVGGFLISAILFAIFILIFIWTAPFSKQNNRLKHKIIYPIVKFVHTILKIKIEVIGKENIPSSTFVVFGNHKSMLDVTILYQAYHTILSAIAKSDLVNVPFLSRLMKGLGVVPLDRNNDREGVKNLLEAIKRVKAGNNYLIFPEGGVKSRETEHMVALRAGAYKLATKPKAVISPVSIIGSSLLAKNCPKKGTKITVIIHKPITPEEYEWLSTNELGRRVANIVNTGIDLEKPNSLPLNEISPIYLGDEND